MPRLITREMQERRLKSQESVQKNRETFLRALKGERPNPRFQDVEPEFACAACKDTAFVLQERFDGTFSSRRCGACKPRVDAEIKGNSQRYVAGADIPDDVPLAIRDYKQAAGLDTED